MYDFHFIDFQNRPLYRYGQIAKSAHIRGPWRLRAIIWLSTRQVGDSSWSRSSGRFQSCCPFRAVQELLCFCPSSLVLALSCHRSVPLYLPFLPVFPFSLFLFLFPFPLPSSPLPCRDSSLPWFTPVHLLIRFKSGPLAPLFPAASRVSWSNRGRSSLTLLSWVRLSRAVLEIFVLRTH